MNKNKKEKISPQKKVDLKLPVPATIEKKKKGEKNPIKVA